MLVKPLVRSIVRSIAGVPTNSLGSGFSPVSLFSDGSKGVVYDNNDLSSFYLDSAGTTAATVNGLVGLQLDKSGNLALGAELLSTGAVGLTGSATVATYNTGTGAGTVTRVDGANQSFVTFTGLSATTFYQVTIQNTGSNILSFRQGTFASTILGDIGVGETKTFLGLATISQLTITMSPVAGSGSFTVVSFKAQSGNHRYQSTTGSKPVLRGTPTGANLVTNGDFASGTAGWNGTNATLSNVSNRLRATVVAGGAVSRATWTLSTTASKTYRITAQYATDSVTSNTSIYVGTVDGVADLLNIFCGSTTGTYVGYFTATGSTTYIALSTTATLALAGEFNEWDNVEVVDVSAGSVTAPYGLQYDGVDDFMQTAAVDFTATDKMFVCAGARVLGSAATAIFVEFGPSVGGNAGTFYISVPESSNNIGHRVRGSLAGGTGSVSGYTAPYTRVLSLVGDIAGDVNTLRANGADIGTSAVDQGTGNFINTVLYFGRRAGTSLPYGGLDFGFVIVGKTLTSTQITQTERYIAQRTGIVL